MNCEKVDTLKYNYIYDLLEIEEKTAFDDHVGCCYHCQEKMQQANQGINLLKIWQPPEKAAKPIVVMQNRKLWHYLSVAAVFFLSVTVVYYYQADQEWQRQFKVLNNTHMSFKNKHALEEKQREENWEEFFAQHIELRMLKEQIEEIGAKIALYRKGSHIRLRLIHERIKLKKLWAKEQIAWAEMLNKVAKMEVADTTHFFVTTAHLGSGRISLKSDVLLEKELAQGTKRLQIKAEELKQKIALFRPGSPVRRRVESQFTKVVAIINQISGKVNKEKLGAEVKAKELKQKIPLFRPNSKMRNKSEEQIVKTAKEEFTKSPSEIEKRDSIALFPLQNSNLEIQNKFKQKKPIREIKEHQIQNAKQRGINLDLLYKKEKPLDGFITAVSTKLPLVMISIGSNESVEKGYELDVYRNNVYLGTIVIEDVYKDASAARIIGKRFKLQKGDSVTTRLGGDYSLKNRNDKNKSPDKNVTNTLSLEDVSIEHWKTFQYNSKWGEEVFESKQHNIAFPPEWNNSAKRIQARKILDTLLHSLTQKESYTKINENPFVDALKEPQSTFSVDVDTASYSNIRRFLNKHTLPPKDAVRLEEMVNYFTYDYSQPQDNAPFSIHTEMATCPWKKEHLLLKIGIQGKKIATLPRSNLVFLVDVSGSMKDANKLPLLKESFRLLVEELKPEDQVAIVTYAGQSRVVLPPSKDKAKIINALENLTTGGGTNGEAGIQKAYQLAEDHLFIDGINRVIIATDGDFNVGISDEDVLVKYIQKKSQKGIFLNVMGFGMGNYKDSLLEKLADNGNGNYAYIDSSREAKKVLKQQVKGLLFTIAKDVKLQLEFNPASVESYRLLGYENRVMSNADFNNDAKDAGDIGAGHSVTAFYQIVPRTTKIREKSKKSSRYQQNLIAENTHEQELCYLKLRYKKPKENKSQLLEFPVRQLLQNKPCLDFQFASSVIGFGLLLRDSEYKGHLNHKWIMNTTAKALKNRELRQEFLNLVAKHEFLISLLKYKD